MGLVVERALRFVADDFPGPAMARKRVGSPLPVGVVLLGEAEAPASFASARVAVGLMPSVAYGSAPKRRRGTLRPRRWTRGRARSIGAMVALRRLHRFVTESGCGCCA